MSAFETIEHGLSLAKRRFSFWDSESRKRRLEDWESAELDLAQRQVERSNRRDLVRAQAAPPPPRKRSAAR